MDNDRIDHPVFVVTCCRCKSRNWFESSKVEYAPNWNRPNETGTFVQGQPVGEFVCDKCKQAEKSLSDLL